MNERLKATLNIAGRLMLSAIFLMSAIGNKIPNFGDVSQYMESAGIPMPALMLVGAIIFLIAGGVSVSAGFKATWGAGMLILFLVLATWFFHDFWSYDPESKEFQMQMIQFMKNMGLIGALTIIAVNGAGPGSVDGLIASSQDKV